jgi:hypothetical protein
MHTGPEPYRLRRVPGHRCSGEREDGKASGYKPGTGRGSHGRGGEQKQAGADAGKELPQVPVEYFGGYFVHDVGDFRVRVRLALSGQSVGLFPHIFGDDPERPDPHSVLGLLCLAQKSSDSHGIARLR